MISLCSVICNENKRYIPYFLDNILDKTNLVSEICFCNIDQNENYHEEKSTTAKDREVKIKHVGINQEVRKIPGICWAAIAHSFGLTKAIKHVSNEYIYMCDPDILLYTALDELYYNWMQQYDLKIVGGAHHIGINYSCRFFPNPINMLIKKEILPLPGALKGIIKAKEICLCTGLTQDYLFEENCLCPCKPAKLLSSFPNPDGIYDTGVLLYWWNEQIKGKWLAFLTQDVHNYTTQFYRSNFQLKERFPKIKLFYHATSGADSRHMFWDDFLKINEEMKND